MSDLFDELFELAFEYTFEFPAEPLFPESDSSPSSDSSPESSPSQEKVVDLTCNEVINYTTISKQQCSSHIRRNTTSHQEFQHEYYRIVIDFLRRGGNPNFVYTDNSCPILGVYFLRYRGKNLLQTCINDFRVTKLLLKCGADIFQKDERGQNSYDYCKDPKIKQYIMKLLRR